MEVTKSIKQRLDLLDVDFQGTIFKKEIKQNWTVRTNSTGYKTAEFEIDKPVVMENPMFGNSRWYSFNFDFSENFPTGIFSSAPDVSVSAYSTNDKYVFQCTQKLPPSNTYTGTFFLMGMDTGAPATTAPTTVHFIVHASGF